MLTVGFKYSRCKWNIRQLVVQGKELTFPYRCWRHLLDFLTVGFGKTEKSLI